MRDITYKNYSKKNDIHGTVLYPAIMVAPVQKDILSDLIDREKNVSILDPFHGSGTALYEAMEVSDQISLEGCDINPLANLITKVKLQGVSSQIDKSIEEVKQLLDKPFNNKVHVFPSITKWFRNDIIISLSHVRNCIINIGNSKDRLFFWCMLCDIIRKYSNTRSSTYKLHIKPQKDINKIENDVVSEFTKSIEDNYLKYNKSIESFKLVKGDALSFLKNIGSDKFNICITSPPYGDNKTTVPYGQFSMLPLFWIDEKDLDLEGWEFDNYSIIDTRSMGGKIDKGIYNSPQDNVLIKEYLTKISKEKQRKVICFFSDYTKILDEISRVTNEYIIMTLGNRTVDGVNIDLTNITIKYLKEKGFEKKEVLEREIVSKRMPKRVSKVRNHSVSSMNNEYVIIMQKNK